MYQDLPHLVLVDDEPDLLLVLRLHFEDQGYAVTPISDGRDALAFLRRTPTPQVVLLDALMPYLDGLQLLTIIAHHAFLTQQHRYAVMTGWYTSSEVLNNPRLAAVGTPIVHKPFDLVRLNATVAQLAHQLPPCVAQ